MNSGLIGGKEGTIKIVDAESYDQRLERLFSFFDKNHKWANVEAVLTRPEGSYLLKEWLFTSNIVTDDGDIYYAKLGAGESPSANEGASRMELRTGSATPAKGHTYSDVTTPITASRKVFDGGYPKTNDDDSDNTGSGVKVVSYRVSWTTSDFDATGIIGGCIHDNASPGGATKLITHFSIASFDKSSSDTLKMLVNHTLVGT